METPLNTKIGRDSLESLRRWIGLGLAVALCVVITRGVIQIYYAAAVDRPVATPIETIKLVNLDHVSQSIMERVEQDLKKRFSLRIFKVESASDVISSDASKVVDREIFARYQSQATSEKERVFVLTTRDLMTVGTKGNEQWVFASTDIDGPRRVGIVSVARISPNDSTNDDLVANRAMKLLLRAIGISLGFAGALEGNCAMGTSGTVEALDRKVDTYCPEHAELARKLAHLADAS